MSDPATVILATALSVSVPSLDGLRGVAAGYERYLPERQLSLTASAQLRESAAGDFLGVHTGVGGELRWYFRARHRAWLSRQPAGSMAGWFTGGRVDLGVAATRDNIDDRWLGSAVEVGATALIGYRIAPWRDLEITPSLGIGSRRELAMDAPDWSRGTLSIGLSVGWLY